jgi:predicted SprT family Zn-dependent metalloprotease
MFHVKPWTGNELNQLLQQVIEEAIALGIPVSRHISPSLFVNSRTKARFGGCKKVKGFLHDTYQIEISKVLVGAESKAIKEIITHEVLHTCPSCMNHGGAWKSYCRQMEKAYGYQLGRTSTYDALGVEDTRKQKSYQYVIECSSCGQQIYRQRKSSLTMSTGKYRCRCGGKLTCKTLLDGDNHHEKTK